VIVAFLGTIRRNRQRPKRLILLPFQIDRRRLADIERRDGKRVCRPTVTGPVAGDPGGISSIPDRLQAVRLARPRRTLQIASRLSVSLDHVVPFIPVRWLIIVV